MVRFGFEHPIDLGVGEGLAEPQRHMNPKMIVVTPGLQQCDLGSDILRQAGGHHAAGGPRPHDDVIGFQCFGHGVVSPSFVVAVVCAAETSPSRGGAASRAVSAERGVNSIRNDEGYGYIIVNKCTVYSRHNIDAILQSGWIRPEGVLACVVSWDNLRSVPTLLGAVVAEWPVARLDEWRHWA